MIRAPHAVQVASVDQCGAYADLTVSIPSIKTKRCALDVSREGHISQPEQAQNKEQCKEAAIGDVCRCGSCWTLCQPWAVLQTAESIYFCQLWVVLQEVATYMLPQGSEVPTSICWQYSRGHLLIRLAARQHCRAGSWQSLSTKVPTQPALHLCCSNGSVLKDLVVLHCILIRHCTLGSLVHHLQKCPGGHGMMALLFGQ